jgi:hypothetical protein
MDSRTIMTRQRLQLVKGQLFGRMDAAAVFVMADPIDELLKEIAAKHGIAVGRDDPIMILQTINARLLEDSATAQQAMLDSYKEELEALSSRWSRDAKGKAERVLNAALEASGNTMRAGTRQAVASVRREIDAVLSGVAGSLRHVRMVVILNVVASCITFLAVTTAVWGGDALRRSG